MRRETSTEGDEAVLKDVVSTGATNAHQTTPLLEIRGVKKSYMVKPILRQVDLTVYPHECVALLGANGAGKTTLLRIIAGLLKPTGGQVFVAGLDSVHDSQQVRHLVGLVAHQPYLYEELTALENLCFFGRMYAVHNFRARAGELLQRVGLERRQHERVRTFSRGQVQRLAWARALLHAPRLLLLDEPDTGMDHEGHALVAALLEEHVAQGGSVLFVTHQLERALQLADRVVGLRRGRVVYQQQTTGLHLSDLEQFYCEVA